MNVFIWPFNALNVKINYILSCPQTYYWTGSSCGKHFFNFNKQKYINNFAYIILMKQSDQASLLGNWVHKNLRM